MDANKHNGVKNRRGWRADPDRFAFICGKVDRLRSCLVKTAPGVVLRYAAFSAITVLRDRTARLTRPTLDARSTQAGRAGDNVGIGCVETPARA